MQLTRRPLTAARAARAQRRAYKLEAWADATDFLEQIARLGGRLGKGGEPDTATAAKMVLLDWQRGRLPFFAAPPGHTDEAPATAVAVAVENGTAAVRFPSLVLGPRFVRARPAHAAPR